MTYQDALHRPMFPYKFKFKSSGCACDCVAAIARADCSIIGTWRDNIRMTRKSSAPMSAASWCPMPVPPVLTSAP